MSTKPIREHDGKRLLARFVPELSQNEFKIVDKFVQVKQGDLANWDEITKSFPWLTEEKLVVKPDQLIKRRGKAGLIGLNLSLEQVKEWISARMEREILVEKTKGVLDTFIVEPFVQHKESEEFYAAIVNTRQGEEILFHHEGGVEVGDVDAKAKRISFELGELPTEDELAKALLVGVSGQCTKDRVAGFLLALLRTYRELHFAYLEINPLVVLEDGEIIPLDLAAKIDETAGFLCDSKWGDITFPPSFGRKMLPAEEYVHELDGKTGASLKLTILNPNGRIWTMVAGGGASVVYADTICDLGAGHELANYGEYSGDPSEDLTFEYARSILKLMTEEKDPQGKILLIGGAIANFTDVARTFKGIIRALRLYATKLVEGDIRIWVRRGGPNFEEGLNMMRELGSELGICIEVYGPEANIVSIVPKALGYDPSKEKKGDEHQVDKVSFSQPIQNQESAPLFSSKTRAVVYGLQNKAVQNMLDFDYLCKRQTPSVACMVFPFQGNHFQKFYLGSEEIMIPVYKSLNEALEKHSDVDVMINFASFRSAFSSTMEALEHSNQLRTCHIIAEGIPEQQTRELLREANKRKVTVIGPASVGGVAPARFRIANSGGMIDNIVRSKLYRPGSVAYVSRSGGLSGELNNLISRKTDGVYEGISIGGDRYPGSGFLDHLIRFNNDPNVKIMVLLGEVGGDEEYRVCEAIQDGRITKPIVAWCCGTAASYFSYDIQFGHAGSSANAECETAQAKNAALRKAGVFVPKSFAQFDILLGNVYKKMVEAGFIVEKPEPQNVPKVPMDFTFAKSLGIVRKPASLVSSISDDRGEELCYAGVPISKIFEDNLGLGNVCALLWFKRSLPKYCSDFIEMVLCITADHGPCVAGSHNTIVCARAGKDLVSSLASGLLTIGPRFGGALDEAASLFTEAVDNQESSAAFVRRMRSERKLISGIGHKIKSLSNPDKRVEIIKHYAKKHFRSTEVLDFALEVEKLTTQKKANLILNVDGCIACCFVDLLRSCGEFSRDEANDIVASGALNALFVVGRSIGLVGHFLDQKRMKQPLYRHDASDVAYLP